jgi:Flp pilus assembly pilin Flp
MNVIDGFSRGGTMVELMRRFIHEEDGQDLVEYALLCCCISLSSVVGLNMLGTGVRELFVTVSGQLAEE